MKLKNILVGTAMLVASVFGINAQAQSNLFANGTTGNAPYLSISNNYSVQSQQILVGDLLQPVPNATGGGASPAKSVNDYSTNAASTNKVTGQYVPTFGNSYSASMVLSMSFNVTNGDTFVTNGGGTVQALFDASTGYGDWTNGWYTLSGTITNVYGGFTNGVGTVSICQIVTNGAFSVFRLHSIYQTNCDYGLTNLCVQYSAPVHKSTQ